MMPRHLGDRVQQGFHWPTLGISGTEWAGVENAGHTGARQHRGTAILRRRRPFGGRRQVWFSGVGWFCCLNGGVLVLTESCGISEDEGRPGLRRRG